MNRTAMVTPPESAGFPWGWALGALGLGALGLIGYGVFQATRAVAGATGGAVSTAIGSGLSGSTRTV